MLLPGVASTDPNVNPLVVWEQSYEGKKRKQDMLRLALVTATTTDASIDSTVWKSCLKFIEMVTSSPITESKDINPVSKLVLDTCRPIFLSTTPLEMTTMSDVSITMSYSDQKKTQNSTAIKYYARKDASMDLISLLRYHLLYSTGGAPIPSASDKVRESCIPPKHREQADALFQTVFRTISNKSLVTEDQYRAIMVRIVSEILTVPLLTWKISDASLNLLLACGRDNSSRRNQPFLVSLIEIFIETHKKVLNVGDLESVLCNDISLNKCNATPTQILLANLVQLGRSSVQINASHPSSLDFEAATIYFQFLATLVDAVPVSTFTSRESVVEWVTDGKGHHSPVVLSPIILEQCRMLVGDAWVRRLFQCAMNPEYLETENILKKKTDKDLKMEKELSEVASSSAASLAAKEARDRNQAFWKSSLWARKLTKGMTNILGKSSDKSDQSNESSGGGLINATSLSRKLAKDGAGKDAEKLASLSTTKSDVSEKVRIESYNPSLFKSLCVVYGIVLSRWGGLGGDDIVRPKRAAKRAGKGKEVATTSPDPCTQSLLSVLCFSTPFIRVSWAMIQSEGLSPIVEKTHVKSTCIRPKHGDITKLDKSISGPAIYFLFVATLAHVLILTDDSELHDMGKPLPIHQLRRCIVVMKELLFKASCTDDGSWSNEDSKISAESEANYFGLALIRASSKTICDLYDRSSRRPICVPKLWTVDDLMEKELRRCKSHQDYVSLLNAPVLRVCPFLVSFKRRLRLFERIVYTNRVLIQGENNQNPFNPNPLKPGIPVRITRGRILEDGLATMNNLGSNMRQRISIQYYNEAGTKETGVDAGGLFKEFWTDLSAIAFDLNFALFCINSENCMYPNPSSGAAHGSDHTTLFEFLGRILGKSLYENITIQPQFAHFFLSFLRGDYNYLQ